MSHDDPLDLKRIDQEIRINELKEEASALGQVHAWESEDCPPDIAEQFWKHVVEYEKAPLTSDFLKLEEMGVALPDPESIADADLSAKLQEIFKTLAKRNTFFLNTDHLSDRELYTHLWEETLREAHPDLPIEPGFTHTYDLVSSGSDEDTHNWLKYFADEQTREQWVQSFPDYVLPAREKPPYDRDRTLPADEQSR